MIVVVLSFGAIAHLHGATATLTEIVSLEYKLICNCYSAYTQVIVGKFVWSKAADISKKLDDKDTLSFEKGIPDPDAKLFAMSFNIFDRIRIIDAPSFDVCVEDALRGQWPQGTQHKKDYHGIVEYKLSGNPWAVLSITGTNIKSSSSKYIFNLLHREFRNDFSKY